LCHSGESFEENEMMVLVEETGKNVKRLAEAVMGEMK
jgi:hypothetical protein